MRRPVTISRTPVADQQVLRHTFRVQQLPALILWNAVGIHYTSFDTSAQFGDLHRARRC